MSFIIDNFDTIANTNHQIEKLKDLVLNLAIRGKLVVQNQEGVSSEALFTRFALEQKELAKNKKVRKRKSLPPLSENEVLYNIPESWIWCRLGEICYDHGQKKPDKKFCYIDVGAIDKEKGEISEDYKILNPEEAPSRARKLVEKGTVIYSTVRPYLLNIAVVNQEFPFEPIVSTAFAILHPYKGVNSEFLFLYLRSQSFIRYVESQMVGVAYPAINDKTFFSGPIPLPPTEEQHRIVQKVNTLFQQIDQLAAQSERAAQTRQRLRRVLLHRLEQAPDQTAITKAWDALHAQFDLAIRTVEDVQALRQTILQLAVKGQMVEQDPNDEPASVLLERIKVEKAQLVKEGKIRKQKALPPISEEEVPFEVPEGWSWCRLGESAFTKSGVTKGKKYKGELITIPYLRVANVQRGFLDLEKMKEITVSIDDFHKYQLESGDLLMTEGGDADKLGRCAIWNNEIDGCIHQNHIFCVRPLDGLLSKYLELFVNSPICREYFENNSKQTTNLASINMTVLRNTPIAIPSCLVQQQIVAKVKRLMAWCDELEATVQRKEAVDRRVVRAAIAGVR